jgi:hypothetical protein
VGGDGVISLNNSTNIHNFFPVILFCEFLALRLL